MLKSVSLGSAGSAAAGHLITGATNATPIVLTVAANSGMKTTDRVAIAGITGNTGANGMWTVEHASATTLRLPGSVGNGTYGGTPRMGLLFDRSPLMRGHSAMMHITGNFVGTLLLEAFESYDEFAAGNNALLGRVDPPIVTAATGILTNTTATPASSSTIASSSLVIAAANESPTFELKLPLILRVSVSAYTSGTFAGQIFA